MYHLQTIYFVRHGESTANAGGITMAHDAIPLSAKGLKQGIEVVRHLPNEPSLVLTSGFYRAQQTAKVYSEITKTTPKIEPLLNEFSCVDASLLTGLNGAQRKPFVTNYWHEPTLTKRMGENADNFSEFTARVNNFLEKMQDLPHQTVVFGHGMWMGFLVWRCLGFECNSNEQMSLFRKFQTGLPMHNCAIYKFSTNDGENWQLQAVTSAPNDH
jgi:alpha-ribazole phosphatase